MPRGRSQVPGGMEGSGLSLGAAPGPGRAVWHRGTTSSPSRGLWLWLGHRSCKSLLQGWMWALSRVPDGEMSGSVPTSVPTHSQTTGVLGAFKGVKTWVKKRVKPCPGGIWAPPGPGRRTPSGVMNPIMVSGSFCILCCLPRAAGSYWELWLPLPTVTPPLSLPPSVLPGVPAGCWGSRSPLYLPGPGPGAPGEEAIKMFYVGIGWFLCNKSRSRCRAAPV